jgi:hypothetical protein
MRRLCLARRLYPRYEISVCSCTALIPCSQLKNLGKRVFNSPTLREDLKTSCEQSKIKPKLMIRAVATRWNTMVELIGRALHLREALTLLVNLEQHNKGRSVRLNRFKLSKQEWELLSQLYPLLEVRHLLQFFVFFIL